MGLIIGVAAGAAVALIASVLLAVFLVRRRKRLRAQRQKNAIIRTVPQARPDDSRSDEDIGGVHLESSGAVGGRGLGAKDGKGGQGKSSRSTKAMLEPVTVSRNLSGASSSSRTSTATVTTELPLMARQLTNKSGKDSLHSLQNKSGGAGSGGGSSARASGASSAPQAPVRQLDVEAVLLESAAVPTRISNNKKDKGKKRAPTPMDV